MSLMAKHPFLRLVPSALAMLAVASGAHAATGALSEITIDDGWTIVTAKPGGTAQGFFAVHNAGTRADTLRSVACPIAQRTVIQNARNHDVRDIPVKAGHSVQFTPAGLHVVLDHPHFRFYPQADIPCSVVFRDAGTMMVYLHVEPAGAASHDASSVSRSGQGRPATSRKSP